MDTDSPVTPRVDGARLPDGRFGKGNAFGRGNPNLTRIHALRTKLLECATDEELVRIVKKLGELAAAGDVGAAKLWLEYALGRPAQAIELSGLDGEPLGISVDHLQAVILTAVGDLPEAQVRIAGALRSLTRPGRPDRPGGEDVADDRPE